MFSLSVSETRREFSTAVTVCLVTACGFVSAADRQGVVRGEAWSRHTIDDGSRGADGARLRDVNGDRLPDLITAWEEGGQIRLHLNPGPEHARERWPQVIVGEVSTPEDAVLVDLDGDGGFDVVSSCEGSTQAMFVHWGPRDRSRLLDATAWKTEILPATAGIGQWMYCVPLDVDGRHGIDLIAGSKGESAAIGLLLSPTDPRRLEDWTWRAISEAGWIMTLETVDFDRDGDADVLLTDRKGPSRGCKWLENPGAKRASMGDWPTHLIGGGDHEVMFADVGDIDRDGQLDVACATRDDGVLLFRSVSESGVEWETWSVAMPAATGTGKAVRLADLDGDGRTDLAVTCENAAGVSGVFWLSQQGEVHQPVWFPHEISGPEGTKFDLMQLIDLDGDEDLDLVTCEERENLGVIWYENPAD